MCNLLFVSTHEIFEKIGGLDYIKDQMEYHISHGIGFYSISQDIVIKSVERLDVIPHLKPEMFPIIFHTRWATHGAICERNSHPFCIDGNFYGIHNGVGRYNQEKMQEITNEELLWRQTETDSEYLLAYMKIILERQAESWSEYLDNALDFLGTHGNIIAWDKKENYLMILKTNRPLWMIDGGDVGYAIATQLPLKRKGMKVRKIQNYSGALGTVDEVQEILPLVEKKKYSTFVEKAQARMDEYIQQDEVEQNQEIEENEETTMVPLPLATARKRPVNGQEYYRTLLEAAQKNQFSGN